MKGEKKGMSRTGKEAKRKRSLFLACTSNDISFKTFITTYFHFVSLFTVERMRSRFIPFHFIW
jgi:hypothetical protein